MADTTFVNGVTRIDASWLNEINDHAHNDTPITGNTTLHSASKISIADTGNLFTATNVEDALAEPAVSDRIATGAITTAKIAANAVTTPKLADSAVTLAKIQNINTSRLLGRSTAGSGAPEELLVESPLSISSGALTFETTTGTTEVAGVLELATSAEVITGTDSARVPSVASFRAGALVLSSEVEYSAFNGPTLYYHDFTSIPSWVKRITVMWRNLSTATGDQIMIQLGDAGGVENTSYEMLFEEIVGASSVNGSSGSNAGFYVQNLTDATHVCHGSITLDLMGSNTWMCRSQSAQMTGNRMQFCTGFKTLSGTLDRVRLTTLNGSYAFDSGTVSIRWE